MSEWGGVHDEPETSSFTWEMSPVWGALENMKA